MLAKSFEGLIQHAQKGDNYKFIRNPEILRKTARTLYMNSLGAEDAEKSFVLLFRFVKVYNQLLKVSRDQKFEKLMLANEVENASVRMEQLEEELSKIYDQQNSAEVSSSKVESDKPTENELPVYLYKLFITSDELCSALKNNNLKLLGIDIRSSSEFISSHMTCLPCINIPEDTFHLGMSAHLLTKEIFKEYLNLWENRNSYDCIVIIDISITPETYEISKAHQLRVIMTDWDPGRSYKAGPVILEGGYREFADRYPMFCKNVHLLLNQYNDDLEDILDLEEVNYPTDNDLYRMKQERTGSEDKITMDESNVIEQNNTTEVNIITEDKIFIDEKNLIDRRISPIIDDFKPIYEESKKKSKKTEKINFHSEPKKPLVDRSTKPSTWWKSIEKLIPDGPKDRPFGLVGLSNIRNTCYMNSALQCIRHLEVVIKYILEGLFKQDLRPNAVIMPQFASLVSEMWNNSAIAIEPYEFYSSFKNLAPVYGEGGHEDISEFLLLLLNYLHEDVAFELNMKDYNTSVKRAWYECQGGMSSYIVEAFFHEMQVTQPCQSCGNVGYKYEVDNVFYLEIPSKDFTITEQLKKHFAPQLVEGYVCKKCHSPRVKVVKSICHYPAVAVFVLKRWMGNGQHTSVNHASCTFVVEDLMIGKATYCLTAIALHSGTVSSGHYTAVCRNPANKRWYEFNDQSITEVDINSSVFRSKVYMLFYSYKFESNKSTECPFFTNYDKIKRRKKRKIEN